MTSYKYEIPILNYNGNKKLAALPCFSQLNEKDVENKAKNYQIILFDADETLFDFSKGERNAFRKVLEKRNLVDSEQWYQEYHKINQSLWKQFERGEITKEKIQQARFAEFFSQQGLQLNGEEANQDFLNGLAQAADLIIGAEELCRELSREYSLYIITNGISKVQKCRFERSLLKPYFKSVFVSEEVGFQKPQKEYFDHVLQEISLIENKPISNEQLLVVGDSLTSDIQGAVNAGLDSCWYHPKSDENQSQIKYTYEINTLTQLKRILTQI